MHDLIVFEGNIMREQASKDFLAVERVDRDEIEESEHEIKRDEELEERKKRREKVSEKAEDEGENKVGNGTS